MPPVGPRRVVLHAGFHKTGTTTVQTFLRWNAANLRPYLISAQNADLRDFIQSTRSYSMWTDPISQGQIGDLLAAFLRGLTWTKGNALLISVEEMSGLLPGLPQRRGRPEIESYAVAPALIGIIAAACRAALGPDTRVEAIFGTRDPESWLRSVYWQHVKTQRMTLSVDAFVDRFQAAAKLDDIVDAVARANPDVATHRFALEEAAATPFGPIGPILAPFAIPADVIATCRFPPPINTAPPAPALAEMLALNRSAMPSDDLKAAKKAIEAQIKAQRGG